MRKMKLLVHPLANINLVKEPTEPTYARTPEQVAAFCSDITNLSQEGFFTISLNSKNRIIERRLNTFGILDSSLIHPREVFRAALYANAKCVVLVHNHPSGDTNPSAEDLRVTRDMIQAGKVVQIDVLDHVIMGQQLPADSNGIVPKSFNSMRENGLCNFG